MKKKFVFPILAALVLCMAFVATACDVGATDTTGDSIGKYYRDATADFDVEGVTAKQYIELKSGGEFVMGIEISGEIPEEDKLFVESMASVKIKGTYEINGNSIVLTPKNDDGSSDTPMEATLDGNKITRSSGSKTVEYVKE